MSEPHRVSEPPDPWTHHFKAEVTELGDVEMTGAAGVILQADNLDKKDDHHITKMELPIQVLRMLGGALYEQVGVTLTIPPSPPGGDKEAMWEAGVYKEVAKIREEQAAHFAQSLSGLREKIANNSLNREQICTAIDEIYRGSERFDEEAVQVKKTWLDKATDE